MSTIDDNTHLLAPLSYVPPTPQTNSLPVNKQATSQDNRGHCRPLGGKGGAFGEVSRFFLPSFASSQTSSLSASSPAAVTLRPHAQAKWPPASRSVRTMPKTPSPSLGAGRDAAHVDAKSTRRAPAPPRRGGGHCHCLRQSKAQNPMQTPNRTPNSGPSRKKSQLRRRSATERLAVVVTADGRWSRWPSKTVQGRWRVLAPQAAKRVVVVVVVVAECSESLC